MIRKLPSLALFIFLVVFVGLTSRFAANLSVDTWYADLVKPDFRPPGWVYGPLWSFLYLCLVFSGWLVWRRIPDLSAAGYPLGLYLSQVLLNGAWWWLFFGLRSPLLGLIDMGLLIIVLVANMMAFRRIHRGAAALLLPVLLWIVYAAFLNACIFLMND